eukprot:4439049-Amphidinium_carterae.1
MAVSAWPGDVVDRLLKLASKLVLEGVCQCKVEASKILDEMQALEVEHGPWEQASDGIAAWLHNLSRTLWCHERSFKVIKTLWVQQSSIAKIECESKKTASQDILDFIKGSTEYP